MLKIELHHSAAVTPHHIHGI